MHDIKVPDDDETDGGGYARAGGSSGEEESDLDPSDYVKVRFTKFVQLVASHNFEKAMKEHGDEDVVVPTNLLTDLANAHEEAPQEDKKKLPMIFLVGIVIGIVITYIVLRF